MAESDLFELVSATYDAHPSLISAPRPEHEGVVVGSITQDSREVRRGSLFCAIRGVRTDGHDWIDAATAAGAVAVLAEERRDHSIPTVLTSDSRQATAHVAAAFHGHPSRSLDLIGVTGTNGKTTIVTLIEHVANHLGRSARAMGTLTASLTTLAAPQFQRGLREAVDDGVDLLAAEVSSHALDQHRVDGSDFRLALFTNLTHDHLDYHVDMDDYFDAKARLFTGGMAGTAIIDVSTEHGRRMADIATTRVREVDPRSIDVVSVTTSGSTFVVGDRTIELPLGGRFNISNALLVVEAFLELGVELDDIAGALAVAPQVPGRFEWIDGTQPFGVVVDYSHTPASLEAAISAAREMCGGRVIVVFGSGGDRDPGKRPLMGRAAEAADVIHVTSDNPRTEDPDEIIDEIMGGMSSGDVHREADRANAIRAAIGEARTGDVVLIAGKGHEDYQEVGATRRPFDDRAVARAVLEAAGWRVAS